jgi:hypothetical protein
MEINAAALELDGIELLQRGVYRVYLRRTDGSTVVYTARVSTFGIAGGDKVKGVGFDSDELGTEAMKGFVDVKAICRAIWAFHDAQGDCGIPRPD